MLLVATTLCASCTQLLYSNQSPLVGQVEGLSRGLTPTEDPATGLYGYLGDLGLWVIKPQFKSASSFSNGMARVGTGGRYGAINPMGQWVIQPVFRSTVDCDEDDGYSIVKTGDETTIFLLIAIATVSALIVSIIIFSLKARQIVNGDDDEHIE